MIKARSFGSLVVSLFCLGTAMVAQAGVSHTYGGTQTINSNANVFAYDVTTDASGNVFVVGRFAGGTVGGTYYDGTTDFNPGAGVDSRTPLQPVSYGDGYVTKINADGSYAWTQTFGNTTSNVFPNGVVVDSAGNVYIAGGYTGTVDFDPGPGTDLHSSAANGAERFLVKLQPDGTFVWSMTGLKEEWPDTVGIHSTKIKIDANDDIYLEGASVPGTFDFDLTAGTDNITVAGGTAAYISKYHADGSYAWTRLYTVSDSNDFVQLSDFAFDSSGNIILLGIFGNIYGDTSANPTVDVDPGAGTVSITQSSNCYGNGFVAALSTDGNYGGWKLKLPRTYSGLALDSQDNLYLTGGLQSGDYNPFSCNGDVQVYANGGGVLTKILGHTAYGWTQRFVPANNAGGVRVMVDSTDNIYVIGSGSAGFYTAPLMPLFIAHFTPTGTLSWLNDYGSGASNRATIDKDNNIYTTGAFSQSADFDPSAGSDIKTPTGGTSAYLTKFTYVTGNIPPVANDDSFSTDQGVKYYGTLSASDAESDPLEYILVTNGTKGKAVITDTATGAFTYSPATGKSGADSFTFLVNDGQLNSNVATVSVNIIPAPPGTDLVMTSLSGPAGLQAGKYGYFSNTVQNLGADKAGTFKVALYLSTDSTITTADTYLGYRSVTSLLANASSTYNTRVTIPAGLAAGNYYIGAIADYQNVIAETDENNNTIATPFEVLAPDLVVSALNGPGTPAAPATYVTVTGTVTNQGKAPSVGTYVGLYFSTDSTITTGDTYLGNVSISALAVDASKAFSKSMKIPAGLSAGTYYVGAIADYKNAAMESDETNNSRAAPVTVYIPTPDLVMTGISVPTVPVAPATNFSVSGTAKNIGTGNSTTTYVGFYLSTDSTITTGDTLLGYVSAGGLAIDASKTVTKTVKLPSGLSAGTYYIGAIADYNNRAAEIDEGNNSIATTVIVYIPTPDLTVTAVSVSPTTAAQRAYLTLTGTITNVGTGKTGTTSYAGFYLSDGVTDTFLKQVSVGGTLAAGASLTRSTTYRLPAGFPAGTYTIKMVADYKGTLTEINEGNNTLSGNTVTVLP